MVIAHARVGIDSSKRAPEPVPKHRDRVARMLMLARVFGVRSMRRPDLHLREIRSTQRRPLPIRRRSFPSASAPRMSGCPWTVWTQSVVFLHPVSETAGAKLA